MNLVLVNLLIAIMNDTFVDVKDHSKLEWMIEMHNLAKEYRCESRSVRTREWWAYLMWAVTRASHVRAAVVRASDVVVRAAMVCACSLHLTRNACN